MKIAIIADIHDNLINLEKCLSWLKQEKISQLICLGDLTNSETLKVLAKNFLGPIYLIRGNIEIYSEDELKKYKQIKYWGRIGQMDIENKKIGFCHEPYLIDEVLQLGKFVIIFYGHTHKPWISEKDGIKIVNPGTLGGVFQKATFAFWDTNKDEPELKILEALR